MALCHTYNGHAIDRLVVRYEWLYEMDGYIWMTVLQKRWLLLLTRAFLYYLGYDIVFVGWRGSSPWL